jgi:hypothetical protein
VVLVSFGRHAAKLSESSGDFQAKPHSLKMNFIARNLDDGKSPRAKRQR